MPHLNFLPRVALALAVVVPLTFGAACGNDDKESSAATTGATPPTPTENRSPSASASAGSAAAQVDLDYVKAICRANSGATASATAKLSGDPSILTDATKSNPVLLPILDEYVAAIEKAKPPADYQSQHDSLLKQGKDVQARLKANQVTNILELANLNNNTTSVPKPTLDRLNAAAKQTPECAAAGPDFFGKAT